MSLAIDTRILWINPVHSAAHDETMAASLQNFTADTTSVDVLSFDPPGPTHLEYATHAQAVAAPLLSAIRWAREKDYDAVCVGCFYDPGLRAAREVAGRMAVTAPAQACLHTAATLGSRVSIMVANRTCLAETRDAAASAGCAGLVASYRSLEMRVHDFQEDPGLARERLRTEAYHAIYHDQADVIVLGCTLEFGLGEALQDELGVPVLDATLTTVAFAEYLSSLEQRAGWHASAVDYQEPPEIERAWLPGAHCPGPLTASS